MTGCGSGTGNTWGSSDSLWVVFLKNMSYILIVGPLSQCLAHLSFGTLGDSWGTDSTLLGNKTNASIVPESVKPNKGVFKTDGALKKMKDMLSVRGRREISNRVRFHLSRA